MGIEVRVSAFKVWFTGAGERSLSVGVCGSKFGVLGSRTAEVSGLKGCVYKQKSIHTYM